MRKSRMSGSARGKPSNGLVYSTHEPGNTPEEVKQDEEGLQIMRYLGRNMAWLLKLKEAGNQNGVALPEQEETRFATNFIR